MGSTPTRNNPRFLHSRTKPLQTLYVCRYENLSIPPGQRLLYGGRHRAVWVCTQIIADGTPIVDESRIYNAPPISNARTVSNATTISRYCCEFLRSSAGLPTNTNLSRDKLCLHKSGKLPPWNLLSGNLQKLSQSGHQVDRFGHRVCQSGQKCADWDTRCS